VFTLVKLSDQFKCSGAVGLLFLKSAFDLSFFNDIEMVSFVSLMENVFTPAHLNHFQAVDQFKFLVLLKRFEELDFFEVL